MARVAGIYHRPIIGDFSGIKTQRELVYGPLQFDERSQYFVGTHDEALSVAMR